ncbi:hypothetical protein KI387_027819, partial [Taxus chinensis]
TQSPLKELAREMSCVRFSVLLNALPFPSGGRMDLQSTRRRGATNIIYKPSLNVTLAAKVSGAESQAAPPPAIEAGGHMKKSSTLYEVLGLNRGASRQDIKTAYRNLARQFHPDAAASSEEKSLNTEMFLQIQNAYAILSKREDRARYDRQLVMQQKQRRNRGAYREPYGHVVRNWETDQCW